MSKAEVIFPPPRPSPSLLGTDDGSNLNYDLLHTWSKRTVESMEDRLKRYVNYFTVSLSHLRIMTDAFEHELHLGLDRFASYPHNWDPSKCSFKMVDSCIPDVPTGRETGVFYGLDFGGTNFRTVRAELCGNGEIKKTSYRLSISSAEIPKKLPQGLMDPNATAADMFNFFATCCKHLMEQEGDFNEEKKKELPESETPLSAGFTFSFPCIQRRIDSAILMEWTKGFQTGRKTNDPVEGLDVCQLMDAAFRRMELPLSVLCVVNDTVGTLISYNYEMDRRKHPPCLIGVILGTGMNACYYEKDAFLYGYKGRVINIECGNFNRELPLCNVDDEVDFAEVSNRGHQRLEKMISGAYLGELCRRAIVKVLQHYAPEAAWKPFSLTSEDVSIIIEDNTTNLSQTASVINQVWGAKFRYTELNVIYTLCKVIITRAASLTAVIISATARKTKCLQPALEGVTVAIDGSLYKFVPYFREMLRKFLDSILGVQISQLVHLEMADDGSGKGAAVLACLAQSYM